MDKNLQSILSKELEKKISKIYKIFGDVRFVTKKSCYAFNYTKNIFKKPNNIHKL